MSPSPQASSDGDIGDEASAPPRPSAALALLSSATPLSDERIDLPARLGLLLLTGSCVFLPACSHALGGGLTGGISTRGRVLLDAEGQLGIAGRLGRRDGALPPGFWSAGISPGLGLTLDGGDATFSGAMGAHTSFTRYVGPHSLGAMLVAGLRFGEVEGQKIAPFFVRLRVGGELELGDPTQVSRELGYSGKPEYYFQHEVVGLWLGAELLPAGAGAARAPDLFFTLTTSLLRRQIDEVVDASP